jgi:phosphoribosylaminoimidazole carboxylase PurE protein
MMRKEGEEFMDELQQNKGVAVIMAGSDSDKPHIQKIAKSLDEYCITYGIRICSAHKQPEALMSLLEGYNGFNNALVYIAVAGGTDALSGTASFHSYHPVISCPPDAPNDTCLRNPPGSSNAYIARADNVGKLVAQMYSHLNPEYKRLLEEKRQQKIEKLNKANEEFKLE